MQDKGLKPKRRSPRGEEARTRILEVAEPVFAAKGYYGASVRDLAKAAGMPTASLLHHYRSKAQLYGAVLARIAAELESALGPAVAPGGPLEFHEAARELCRRLVAWTERRSLRSRILLRELLDVQARLDEVPRWHLAPLVEALTSFVSRGQQAGAFRPVEPLFFIVHLVGSVSYFDVSRPTFARIAGRSELELTERYRESAQVLTERLLLEGS